MDIVATYESYCNFLDLLDDTHDDYIDYAIEGPEGAGDVERSDTRPRRKKDFAKGNGLVAAIVALFDGFFTALRKLFGVDDDRELEDDIEYYVPSSIAAKINAKKPDDVLAAMIQRCHTLSRYRKGDPQYEEAIKELDELYDEYEKHVNEIKQSASTMKSDVASQSVGWKVVSLIPFTQAKKARKAANQMAKYGNNGDKILKYINKILALHCDQTKTMKRHGWFRRKTRKILKKEVKAVKNINNAKKYLNKVSAIESVTDVVYFIE